VVGVARQVEDGATDEAVDLRKGCTI
jgi:hypothetical protein